MSGQMVGYWFLVLVSLLICPGIAGMVAGGAMFIRFVLMGCSVL